VNGLKSILCWTSILGLIIIVLNERVTICSVHQFLRYQNEKPKTEQKQVCLDWFSLVLNRTRQGQILFRFGLDYWFRRFCPNHLRPYSQVFVGA